MRYFAILKDSLREALDSKVLYVMMAMSTIAILFVACISFKPLSAEKTMEQFFLTGSSKTMPLVVTLNINKPEKLVEFQKNRKNQNLDNLVLFSLKKVELVEGEPDAPESEYALTVSYRPWPEGMLGHPGLQKIDDEPAAVRAIFKDAEEFGFLNVGNVELVEKGKNESDPRLYRVTIKGTPKMIRIWLVELTLAGVIPLSLMTSPPDASGARLLTPFGFQLFVLTQIVLFFGSWTAVLVGVIITSFFIPNMLRKGTVDLLVSKPIHRWTLLLYKYVGGLFFVFLNTAYAMVGIWLALGIRTGLWPTPALMLVLTITFFFAILYAVSTLVGVVTRSTVTAILVTIVAWILCFGIGGAHSFFARQQIIEQDSEKKGHPLPEEERWGDNAWAKAFRFGHAVIPRTSDLEQMNGVIVYTAFMSGNLADLSKFDNSDRNWWESLLVSLIWIALLLGLASLWFTFNDY